MPPKGSKVAKKKAPTSTTTATKKKATMDGEDVKPRRQQNNRRDLDQKIDRAIVRHFVHLPKICVETKVVNGKTLRQRLNDDFSSKDSKGERLGAKYYSTLGSLYEDASTPIAQLQVTDVTQPINDTLYACLEQLGDEQGVEKAIAAIVAWLPQAPVLNQREFVGLLKVALRPQLLVKTGYDQVVLAVMQYCARTYR